MSIAIFPGSFDPITNGHLDILKRGCKIFDKVIVAVAYNCEKQGFLPVDVREKLIRECTKEFKNIEVVSFEGLTVNFAQKHNADVILRGLRNSKDFEYEYEMEGVNRILNPDIQTVFLTANGELNNVSSSAVREILANNGDISKFVPKNVKDFLVNYKNS